MRRTFLLVLLAPMTPAMDRMMYALLREAGIGSEECDVAYLLGGEQPGGAYDRPTLAQLQRTGPSFRLEMEGSLARCVIPVGPEAFRAVTGLSWGIDDARGYVIRPMDTKPVTYRVNVEVGTYKGGQKKGQPKFQNKLVPLPPPLPLSWGDDPGIIVPTISFKQFIKQRRRQITGVMAALSNARAAVDGVPLIGDGLEYRESVDLEVGPYPTSNAVTVDVEAPKGSTAIERFSLHFGGETFTLPWTAENKAFLNECLERSNPVVAHNIQYDEPMLRANGIEVPEPWFDTMICASLLEPDLPKGLGKVVPVYALARPWKHLSEDRGYNDPEYSARDAFMEHHLFEQEWRTLEEWGMTDLFTKRIMPSVKALIRLKEDGLRVDVPATEAWCGTLRQELAHLMHWWDEHFPGVSPTSNKDVNNLLYKTWALPVQRSKHDGWSADELALRTLMGIEPKYAEPIGKLLEMRGVSKLLNTYGRALIGNDRVHPAYLPKGKDTDDKNKGLPGTGRLASSGPNIQNQPPSSRALYLPDHDDWVFLSADQSQAELRVTAARSGDLALLSALEGDVHARTMELIGCGRTLAKNGIYGTSYGAGPRRLVEMLRENGIYMSEKAMREFQGALARAYPDWWAYLQATGETGRSQGFLRNPFGRVRRFTAPESDVPAMKDYEPQSTVGDIGWTIYRPISDAALSLGGRLSILVHDEVVVQGPRSKVKAMSDMLHDEMEREFDEVAPGFVIPIKVKVGQRWGKDMVPEEEWK